MSKPTLARPRFACKIAGRMSIRLKNVFWFVLVLGAFGLKLWLDSCEVSNPPTAAIKTASTKPPKNRTGFTILEGARLMDHRHNDGDSFHISHGGSEYEFRLYFVDCPESRLHQFNADRIRQQGRYFGGLRDEQTIAIGQEAKAFTRRLIERGAFTIHTRWQPVYDSGRYYAFVFFTGSDGSCEELSEKLVKAGLCRIHTEGTSLPDGRREKEFEQHLRALEKKAKAAKLGAWRF